MNKDLTSGEPWSVLWRFCLPLFASVIFQQLYNIADSLVAGRFLGENALAAVGNSYEITLIFIAIAFGCNMGCSVIVSQLFGAKNYKDLKTAVTTSVITTAVILVILILGGLLSGSLLLDLIKTPQEIFPDSLLYLNIYILGLPFLFFYNIATGIFSALGDSKTPFYFLAFSSTANILVDILFVAGFHMGVAGVAYATFLCQGISAVASFYVVVKRLTALETREKAALFSFPLLKKIAAIAIPSMLQQSFISIGNIIIQGVINGFGFSVTAGYAAGVKLNNMIITAFTTLGNGISNYTAQNMGAGKLSRIKDGYKAGIRMVWMICLPVSLLYFFAGHMLVGFFMTEPSKLALLSGVRYLQILAPFYFVVSAKLVSDGILRGSGMMNEFMIGTFTDLILRVILAFLFSKSFGWMGIWCAWPVGWSIATILSFLYYRRGPWFKK